MIDCVIIGGGIVGLSVAMHLMEKRPSAQILVLEKEAELARHQTGRNSGVIHSGIYYRPGSLKARFARRGKERLVRYCMEHGIPYEICGKLIVAVEEEELPRLEALYRRGLENGLAPEMWEPEQIREVEPHVRAVAGIRVPDTGIVDFRRVADSLADRIRERGGEVRLGTRVTELHEYPDRVDLKTSTGKISARWLVNCAGLFSDRVAAKAGVKTDLKIVPFRGEYYHLKQEKKHLVQHLIYPVPDPAFPFLGVHFTRMMDGDIHVGPNAVLSLKREGYRKSDVSLKDAWDIFTHPAFWKIARAHLGEGMKEMARSWSKRFFLHHVQKYIPEIESGDLEPAPAGVRAQALWKNGKLLDDFRIERGIRSVHVLNAPSPAATASLEIGRHVVEKLLKEREWMSPRTFNRSL
ncbi:L-2-hydroxyglutarate oxidase [Melghirimyces profundicolus]|uniref:L-2-hydroxyglutarate oxidase n=1 Tax=Melghirimyces profundicolus TaxID=1242148 RepID=A0A2T6C0D7_9BACL|nr:L-2-hydroxyglutarate oxidase [Melghirimyces profundicolus]PTX61785.1 L-2-hydroxyglutarate oxidase [Melghirimyces profundicolus]